MLRDPDAAADVAQNAFMKLLGGSGAHPPQVSFRVWLYTIAPNGAIDELRKQKRTVPMPNTETEEREELPFQQVAMAPEDDPERAALDKEMAALVWQAAKGLSITVPFVVSNDGGGGISGPSSGAGDASGTSPQPALTDGLRPTPGGPGVGGLRGR